MKAAKLILFILLLGAFFGAYEIQRNWWLHSRVDLLTHGLIGITLAAPASVQPFPDECPRSLATVSLVYKKGQYVGYLDKFGNFVQAPLKECSPASQLREMVVLQATQIISLVGVLLLCAHFAIKWLRYVNSRKEAVL
jgi:hypothetical protein